jgi:hypothetical protein
MGGYTKAVSGQWLDKSVPAATDTKQQWYSNRETVFLWPAQRLLLGNGAINTSVW